MTKPPWRLIPHETGEGVHNLGLDAHLLNEELPFPILRFYSWSSPCISYGYFQAPPSSQKNLPAYRRVTGGGIVFHDRDLTYSLTVPRNSVLPWSVKRSYKEIHRMIQHALDLLGVQVSQCTEEHRGDFCFESPVAGDLLYEGKKIAGAAQRRKGNHLLHQGTILVEHLGIDRLRLVGAMIEEFKRTYQITFETSQNEKSHLISI